MSSTYDAPSVSPAATGSRLDQAKEEIGNAFNRGVAGVTGSAADANDQLAQDVRQLKDSISSIQQTLTKLGANAGNEAFKAARDVGNTVASQASAVAGEVTSAATEQMKTFANELESAARRNPLATIGATLMVGVVIGMMSRGRA